MPFTGEQVINGKFGSLLLEGEELANIVSIDATVDVERRDVPVAGSLAMSRKRVGWSGEGTFTIHRVDSLFVATMVSMIDQDTRVPIFTMDIILSDPDSRPANQNAEVSEKISLGGVKLWTFPWGFDISDLIQQQISFTFESIKQATADRLGTPSI